MPNSDFEPFFLKWKGYATLLGWIGGGRKCPLKDGWLSVDENTCTIPLGKGIWGQLFWEHIKLEAKDTDRPVTQKLIVKSGIRTIQAHNFKIYGVVLDIVLTLEIYFPRKRIMVWKIRDNFLVKNGQPSSAPTPVPLTSTGSFCEVQIGWQTTNNQTRYVQC